VTPVIVGQSPPLSLEQAASASDRIVTARADFLIYGFIRAKLMGIEPSLTFHTAEVDSR
jgi:hypothetical protein